MISRVAIVNRGEAAMRLIHAVRELNAQGGAQIETIALHTDGESAAKFVREADSAFAIGPARSMVYGLAGSNVSSLDSETAANLGPSAIPNVKSSNATPVAPKSTATRA